MPQLALYHLSKSSKINFGAGKGPFQQSAGGVVTLMLCFVIILVVHRITCGSSIHHEIFAHSATIIPSDLVLETRLISLLLSPNPIGEFKN